MPEESAQGTPTRKDRKRNASAYGGSCTDRANVTPDASWAEARYMGTLHGSCKPSLSIVQA
ncbi:hypothetical protein PY546_00655 [Providencia stuartii]|nr:hypothetical protein [Providencia stuartii]